MNRIKRGMRGAHRLLAALLLAGAALPSAAAEKTLSIGISVSDLGNPYFIQIARGAEMQAKQLVGDNAEVVVVSSAYDVKRQIEQIESFVAQGMDMILLSAASYDGVEAAVLKAREAGVKVLAVDVKAKGADATITTDNTQAGMIACDYLVKQLGGKGDVVIINGPKVSSVKDRVAGCKAVLAQSPGIQLLSSDLNSGGGREGGLESMTYLLTQFQQIDGVFSINDPSALGAQDAAQFAGRGEFIIASVDGAPLAQQQLRRSDSLICATAAQFPNYMAAKAVETGYRLMQGETLEQTTILIPAKLITRETVDSYQGW
ncbi:monosaccharide ABC transporter substrate-binding protein, CUT2 family (TC 3.A.1.2.-) [Amphritea atlantica]|uniref:Monosaccharide ABC transporter substrate-binding protein, CUT2 family (TC 3.A.1.2.-) n=1 Tax=Amphritea atlantica TaxID=355243 RepID=A0A1H9GJN3_9GAMM|nr:ABC transporter substrate-binding protein [Amphritea atlantica]SEQ50264.1 monosaccharide ABC transporter substrate-binding protein, CUT2 family (TC 3.A.1.2.-) [Amphritea atlantica]